MAKSKTTRPTPPEDLDGEALLEWHRVTAELEAHELLDRADRCVMTLHCRTYAAWHKAATVVAIDGPVVLLPNNWPGESSESKVMDKFAKTLLKTSELLGLSPAARTKIKPTAPVEDAAEGFNF